MALGVAVDATLVAKLSGVKVRSSEGAPVEAAPAWGWQAAHVGQPGCQAALQPDAADFNVLVPTRTTPRPAPPCLPQGSVYLSTKAALQKVLGVGTRATARDLCIQVCGHHTCQGGRVNDRARR